MTAFIAGGADPVQDALAMSAVVPGFVYLGSMRDAHDVEQLKHADIRWVLNMAQLSLTARFGGLGVAGMLYRKHDLAITIKGICSSDKETYDISQHFDECFEFIEQARAKNERVLVHCAQGISRSPTVVIAYLMRQNKWDYFTARRFVRQQRPIVYPNLGFVRQLKEYEQALIREGVLTAPASGAAAEEDDEQPPEAHVKRE
eukprot:TRINITY_DN27928_c0_g1_i1.p2 TRINITY_DN27928_c0_g1~~TRINITY_DN27928_c0_g1_i1.p2  ORF type:complete len:202 (-),score=69.31 TRINITY_DN27928_c0_g1_i1:139-744(-)